MFARVLPLIRARVDADLRRHGLPCERVLATIVRLLELTLSHRQWRICQDQRQLRPDDLARPACPDSRNRQSARRPPSRADRSDAFPSQTDSRARSDKSRANRAWRAHCSKSSSRLSKRVSPVYFLVFCPKQNEPGGEASARFGTISSVWLSTEVSASSG
jgi:hypothetical protein